MAKKKVKTKAKTTKKKTRRVKRTSSGAGSLNALEARIKRVDRDLLKKLGERATLSLRISELRKTSGLPAPTLAQDEEAVCRMISLNKSRLADRCVRAVFRELVSGCRSLRQELRVAFLGPEYSYSHLAAIHRFGQSVEFAPVDSISAVFEEVNRGHCDFGIVPIENSTDGRIADTLDMFTRLPVRICGEVELEIHHALLGKCSRNEVKEVYSRPQALSQTRNWLAKHLPAARTIEVTSTSTAAQLASEKPGAAAIASIQAGVHYGLETLAERIEDNPTNTTRFTIIGEHSASRTGNDHTAMMFQVEHRPGALAEALGIFKRNRLNLTWIESFPIPGSERAYLFFVEMEGHEADARVRRATEALEKKTLRLEILGSCPVTAPVD
jgi:chorismate mutase/prephenate dehydratase